MKLNWAERWVVNNPIRVQEQRILVRLLKRMLPLNPGRTVLEIGCGRGAGAAMILAEFQPAVLHAMDLDICMIQKAGSYLTSTEKRKISFFAGDALHLPYRSESLDAVFGFGVLHHIPDWRSTVVEIARVLKTGGVYYLEELYPSLYQNFITKHILLHPEEDRFFGHHLKEALNGAKLNFKDAMEIRKVGILGVFIKA
ncbi:MAG: class I SAM-dependent methyltransferase [Desulforhabdus sp.]|jgi:ubiquinone/menaquinone biosynthesis C-methylase UbiE|nr:class I SAM-dependent methyltransferase [Desulforhabdus sp.]